MQVYVIRSVKQGRLYVGSARDAFIRLQQHNRGQSPATRSGIPWL
ncbi:MAG: GIY-YIG nuclease family protein [Deltaproteobacteria bacterium]